MNHSFGGWIFSYIIGYNCKITVVTLKSTSVSVCFRGTSRLPSAFVFLRRFKLAHISFQVCTFYDGCKQGIDHNLFAQVGWFHIFYYIFNAAGMKCSLYKIC